MQAIHHIRWRNRLISWFPSVLRLTELKRLIQAAGMWRRSGWFLPPPYFVRRAMLLTEARAIKAVVLVETGTFLGDTSWGLKNDFHEIYTIEIEPTLAGLALERFRNQPSVHVLEGNSGDILPKLCMSLVGPCLFYLDGHYSGGFTGKGAEECPILQELKAIFDNTTQEFRIIIDDARLFGTDPSYPDIDSIADFLSTQTIQKRLRIENDAILIL